MNAQAFVVTPMSRPQELNVVGGRPAAAQPPLG